MFLSLAEDRHLILVFCGKLFFKVCREVCMPVVLSKITTNSNTREECLRRSQDQMFHDIHMNSTQEHAYVFFQPFFIELRCLNQRYREGYANIV